MSIPVYLSPSGLQVVNLCSVVTVSLLFYDAALCMDHEIELVWWQRWTLSKFLYLICRYIFVIIILVNLVVNTSVNPPEHHVWTWISPGLSVLAADALVLVRLDALYLADSRIRFFLLLAYGMHVIVAIIVGIVNATVPPILILSRTPLGSTHRTGCAIRLHYVSDGFNKFILIFPLLMQTFYFVLTVVRCLNSAKEIRMTPRMQVTSVLTMTKTVPIMFGLLRDGATYFFVTSVIYIGFILLATASPELQLWIPGIIMMQAANPFLAARLYLCMKARHQAENGNGTQMLAFEEGLDFALPESEGIAVEMSSLTSRS